MAHPYNPAADGLAMGQVVTGKESIPAELALTVHRQMVRTRVLEERSIKMSKSGEGYFWVGGPGEEAFNVALGMQTNKGRGPAHDYLHLHYRNAGVMLAMGMPMADHFRQMAMRATDPHSLGRNFVCHYAVADWNVINVTSVIEVQYVMAPGTALVQRRHGGEGITAVVGGDAGTAEGDFASGMIWSTRPGHELPVLFIVTNNRYGISTPAATQHGERHIADRGKAFGIRGEVIDGNDPVTAWRGLERAMQYCRRERKPFLLEVMVSRLHGHSSSSGAARDESEFDPLRAFEERLIAEKFLHRETAELILQEARAEADAEVERVMGEAEPTPADVERMTYAPSPHDAVYPEDYTGLPGIPHDSLEP